jgi:hypothetical protein
MKRLAAVVNCVVLLMACAQPADTRTLAYLERTLWHAGPGETVACSYQELGRSTDKIYSWVLCQSFANTSATPIGGVSAPVVLNVGIAGNVVSHQLPRDGSAYALDLLALFPANLQGDLNAKGDAARARHEALVARVLLRISRLRGGLGVASKGVVTGHAN